MEGIIIIFELGRLKEMEKLQVEEMNFLSRECNKM
jgi:hypothetical protein